MNFVIEAGLGIGVILAGALGRRFDGGLLSQWAGRDLGRWQARAAWAAVSVWALAVCHLVQGAPDWWLVLSALWLPLGSAVWGNAGKTLKTTLDYLSLLLHGVSVMAVPILVAWFIGMAWWHPLAVAILTVPLYMLANRVPVNIPWLGCRPGDPEPLAELVCGGAWLAGIFGAGLHYYG
jgi:hypothetical protein